MNALDLLPDRARNGHGKQVAAPGLCVCSPVGRVSPVVADLAHGGGAGQAKLVRPRLDVGPPLRCGRRSRRLPFQRGPLRSLLGCGSHPARQPCHGPAAPVCSRAVPGRVAGHCLSGDRNDHRGSLPRCLLRAFYGLEPSADRCPPSPGAAGVKGGPEGHRAATGRCLEA
jgi:hypothetical protein